VLLGFRALVAQCNGRLWPASLPDTLRKSFQWDKCHILETTFQVSPRGKTLETERNYADWAGSSSQQLSGWQSIDFFVSIYLGK